MTLAHVFSGARPSALPSGFSDALSDVAIKVVYFSLTVTAFVFVSILLTGVHPVKSSNE